MSALRIVTWNVNGLEPLDLDVRTEAQCLLLLLRERQPHVVMLQEVVDRSWHAHFKHHFAAAHYVPVPENPPASTSSEYYSMMWVKKTLPIKRAGADRFPNTTMGRHLVWAEVDWEGTPLLVATSHLESTKGASALRVAQLGAVIDGLRNHDGPAVFGGDTNLRKVEEAKLEHLTSVTDAWSASGASPELRATWPSVPRGKGPGARFDRVYVHDATVTGFRLIGQTAPGLPFPPSDHLAIEVVVEQTA